MCLFISAYEQALEHAETEEDRSQIHAAMGKVMFKAGDIQGAKSALFTWFVVFYKKLLLHMESFDPI